MKPRFMEFRRILLRKFPGVPIVGKVYPPGDDKIMIATAAQYGFFLGIAVIFFGEALFKAMGMAQPPEWYANVQQNKMQACMFLWIANSLATSQLATGAFEIWYDGDLIFSKLEEHRWPHPEEIIRALQIRGVPAGGGVSDNSF